MTDLRLLVEDLAQILVYTKGNLEGAMMRLGATSEYGAHDLELLLAAIGVERCGVCATWGEDVCEEGCEACRHLGGTPDFQCGICVTCRQSFNLKDLVDGSGTYAGCGGCRDNGV